MNKLISKNKYKIEMLEHKQDLQKT